MDPQPLPRLLTGHPRALLALALLLVACGGEEAPPARPLPALAGPVSLLRFPREGGQVVAYLPEELTPADWTSSGRLPALRRTLGADLDERLAYAIDTENRLVAVDLETRAVRTNLMGNLRAAAIAGDGSLYAVDDAGRVTHLVRRTPTRYRATLPGTPRQMFGAINDRLVAVHGGDSPRLTVLAPEADPIEVAVPPGEAAATLWGELVAVATDQGIVLYDTQRRELRPILRLGGAPRALAFSPSGHRLYVARDRGDLVVLDRFTQQELATVRLEQPATALRPDATGRWLLLRPASGDSILVMDATDNRVVARVASSWDPDLPLVAGASTLVVRRGRVVESWSLTQTIPGRTGVVSDGGSDFWSLIAWVPPSRASEAAAAVEEASAAQDSALVFGSIPPPSLSRPLEIFLQVSSSQNAGWARELARQLTASGYSASVRDPVAGDEGYRVVIGPYPSREEAEAAGRRLGRPYFLLSDPPNPRER